ncbi:MAG: hypothetical protein KA419_10445 [Acidobacteria bacterium]|nr:hypothetical protein [Acidobacteriota bacterium]
MIVVKSSLAELVADAFQFDKASYFNNSTFTRCAFRGARLRHSLEDVAFEDTDFSSSTFVGGMEYGFRRCRFFRCTFENIDWHHTFIRASEFRDCNFFGGTIRKSILAGFKFFGTPPPKGIVSECENPSIFFEGAPLRLDACSPLAT